jgi:transcriptional regulator with XRE-family HTH domain
MVARIGPKRPHRHYLREWRERRGLTQQQLAERLDTGADQISRWESGKRGMSADVLFALSEALNIEVVQLFRDPASPSIDDLLIGKTQERWDQAHAVVKALVAS